MPAKRNIIGQTFGRLKVLSDVAPKRGKNGKLTSFSLCRCKCGKEKTVKNGSLCDGSIKSCGCLQKEMAAKCNTKHGLSTTKEYRYWAAAKSRCNNPNNVGYKNYGAKGIKLSPEWENSPVAMINAMGPRPSGQSLERPNRHAGYSKSNCCWATQAQQMRNTSRNINLTVAGITGCFTDLCKHFGKKFGTVHSRIYRSGWPIEQAFIQPVQFHKRCD